MLSDSSNLLSDVDIKLVCEVNFSHLRKNMVLCLKECVEAESLDHLERP